MEVRKPTMEIMGKSVTAVGTSAKALRQDQTGVLVISLLSSLSFLSGFISLYLLPFLPLSAK